MHHRSPKIVQPNGSFWGVTPVLCPDEISDVRLQNFINTWAKDKTDLETGDSIVIVTDTEVLPGVHDSVLVARLD